MIQYYRDLWATCLPLSPLWLESVARPPKKVPWHWDEVHQKAFDDAKATIAKEVILAYPDFNKVFEIFTDASTKQLDAVITQANRPNKNTV